MKTELQINAFKSVRFAVD